MTQACVELPVWIWRTSRNISFKAKIESSIFHGGRQSGANESQQECNAVWLILGSLSVWFYWEKWDDDRWISALTAGVEGRVIVAEMWRVFSVSRHVRRGQSIRAFIWTLQTHRLCRFVTQSGSVLTGVAGVTPVSVLFHCWGCHGWCCGGWCWGGKHWVGAWGVGGSSPGWMWADGASSGSFSLSVWRRVQRTKNSTGLIRRNLQIILSVCSGSRVWAASYSQYEMFALHIWTMIITPVHTVSCTLLDCLLSLNVSGPSDLRIYGQHQK